MVDRSTTPILQLSLISPLITALDAVQRRHGQALTGGFRAVQDYIDPHAHVVTCIKNPSPSGISLARNFTLSDSGSETLL